MVNSRQKGKRGELEFVNWLKDKGISARRSQQYCGANEDADIITDMKDLHIEVKRVETLNLQKAFEKAIEECGDKTPCVVHRKNGKQWLITLRAEDYFNERN